MLAAIRLRTFSRTSVVHQFIKEECLSRMRFFGPASLQHAVRQFMAHYHTERNHQGLENRLPQPGSIAALPHHPVQRRQRLGGMLSYYHRAAA